MKKFFLVALALSWMMTLAFSCTDTAVEVVNTDIVPEVDDQLLIEGRVCTDPPEDSDFPVKIMFIVDCSGSMQQTDEGMHRVEAVREVVRRYANNPNVSFNMIKFNGRVGSLTQGFVQLTGNEPEIFGPQGLMEADSMTDYQGALGVAYQQLLADMMKVSEGGGGLAELGRTKYVIIFFSDGTPDPVCYGCVTAPPDHPRYSRECHEDLHVVCTLNDTFVIDLDRLEPGMAPGLEEGTDYNHNYQIFQLVDAIMDLKETFHVGEMRLHTAFLYCRDEFGNPTSALCEAAEVAYNLDADRGRALMREIARRGQGTFRDFTSGQDINFLKIDYTSIKRSYGAKNLVAVNRQSWPGTERFLPDSDGDGLDDEGELREGTDPLKEDTDADGYSDFIETRRRNAGFDPLRADRPETPCAARQDSDGDGLRACEEKIFRIDDKLVDTDADGFGDWQEVLSGTDTLRKDVEEDIDGDGRSNGQELLYGTHPGRADIKLWADSRYWYEMWPVGGGVEGQQCYGFEVRRVTLVTTRDRNGPGSQGYNDVLVWFTQASYDDPMDPGRHKVACVRAQYIAPDYKIPLGGRVKIDNSDFLLPPNLDTGFSGGNCVTSMK